MMTIREYTRRKASGVEWWSVMTVTCIGLAVAQFLGLSAWAVFGTGMAGALVVHAGFLLTDARRGRR